MTILDTNRQTPTILHSKSGLTDILLKNRQVHAFLPKLNIQRKKQNKTKQTFLLFQCEMNITRNSFCWEPLDIMNDLQFTQLQTLALKDS